MSSEKNYNTSDIITSRRRRTVDYINDPANHQVQVTEPIGVRGISHDITVSIGPTSIPTLGGWRISPAEQIVTAYESGLTKNRDTIIPIVTRPEVPNNVPAQAGVVEATGLGKDMVFKWGGADATVAHASSQDFYREDIAERIDHIREALRHSGGKSVAVQTEPGLIIGTDRVNLMMTHAEHIIRFNKDRTHSPHTTAPDSGTHPIDMNVLHAYGASVASMSELYGGSEDPSPFTAKGVFYGIKGMLEHYDKDGNDMTFAVQGAAGEVAKVLVADLRSEYPHADIAGSEAPIKEPALLEMQDKYGLRPVYGDEIFRQGGMFVPSAISNQLDEKHLYLMTNGDVRTELVNGPANYLYPLGSELEMSEQYMRSGIIVGPAALGNQHGIRNISEVELMTTLGYEPLTFDQRMEMTKDVGPMLVDVLKEADATDRTPDAVFRDRATDRIADLYGISAI